MRGGGERTRCGKKPRAPQTNDQKKERGGGVLRTDQETMGVKITKGLAPSGGKWGRGVKRTKKTHYGKIMH